jgi:hypothetical protein
LPRTVRGKLRAERAFDRVQIVLRETGRADDVIDVEAVALVGRHSARGGVRLLDESRVFKLRHHVADRRGAPPGRVRAAIRDGLRAHGVARPQMFADDFAQHETPARVGQSLGRR